MPEQVPPENPINTPQIGRREFIKGASAGAATAALAGCAAVKDDEIPAAAVVAAAAPAIIKKIGPSDEVRLGYIGVGVRGKQHMRFSGFAHPKDRDQDKQATVNLPRKLNVRAVAMSDCFEGNRQWASETVPGIKVYPNFEDLLADKDVDGIFIGTSDHNHAPIGIKAAQAGKHIYSEKSFANTMEDAIAYRAAVKKAGIVFQLGHQTRSGSIMEKARKALGGIGAEGTIGKVTLIETYTNRNTANAAWKYGIPQGAGPNNVDWDRFLMNAPKRDFDLDRFFRFRKYWDYGTGQAGDLISHELDAIQQITGLGIPDTAVASGGLYFPDWDIGSPRRETPDVLNVVYQYEKEGVAVSYNGTMANANPRERRVFGKEGTLDMSYGIKIFIDPESDRYAKMVEDGKWELAVTDKEDDKLREQIYSQTSGTNKWAIGKGILIDIIDGKMVNVNGLHILNFVECIRDRAKTPNCNIDHAFEEAVIVHMANQAYHSRCRVRWDAKNEKIVKDV